MIRTVLLVPFLILVSYFCGRAIMLVSGIFSKDKKEFFSSVSAGVVVILGVSFASHLLAVMTSSLLSSEKKIFGIATAVVMTILYFLFVIMTFMNAVKNKDASASDDKKPEKKETASGADKDAVFAVVIAVAVSLACLICIASGTRIDSEGDETLETVRSFIDNNVMFSLDPLKGVPYAEGLPFRHKILCLPGLYAVLSSAFGISPELLVCHVMPAFWFFAGLCAICSLSSGLFREDKNRLFKRAVFVIFSVIFIFGADLNPYAQGFGIISAGWTGYAVRTWFLAPLMLSLLVRKKYVLALLPVLCEAFICRTQYGIGFLACIYVLYILAFIVGERRRHA